MVNQWIVEQGASAYAKVFRDAGFIAYMTSRAERRFKKLIYVKTI